MIIIVQMHLCVTHLTVNSGRCFVLYVLCVCCARCLNVRSGAAFCESED